MKVAKKIAKFLEEREAQNIELRLNDNIVHQLNLVRMALDGDRPEPKIEI